MNLTSTDLANKKFFFYNACWVVQCYANAFATPQNLLERSRNMSSIHVKQIRMKNP